MTELQPVTKPSGAERRRSSRVRLAVPLQATWTNEQGGQVSEYAETEVFNAQGGLLCMKTGQPIAMEIQLTNPQTQETARARVVGFRESRPKGVLRVAVELASASQTFWGVSFPAVSGTATRFTGGRGDSRNQRRVSLFTQIESRSSGATSLGRTRNISMNGLLVESRDTFDPQTNVIVRFSLASGHTIQAEGVVMHSLLGVHMGIKFIKLKDDDRKIIEHFVKQVAPRAARELS